mgnify:FL=1
MDRYNRKKYYKKKELVKRYRSIYLDFPENKLSDLNKDQNISNYKIHRLCYWKNIFDITEYQMRRYQRLYIKQKRKYLVRQELNTFRKEYEDDSDFVDYLENRFPNLSGNGKKDLYIVKDYIY